MEIKTCAVSCSLYIFGNTKNVCLRFCDHIKFCSPAVSKKYLKVLMQAFTSIMATFNKQFYHLSQKPQLFEYTLRNVSHLKSPTNDSSITNLSEVCFVSGSTPKDNVYTS